MKKEQKPHKSSEKLKVLSKFKQKIEAKLSKTASNEENKRNTGQKQEENSFRNPLKNQISEENLKLFSQMREVLFGKKPKEGIFESKITKELEKVSFSRENENLEKNKENDSNLLDQKEVISSLKSLFKNSEFMEKGR